MPSFIVAGCVTDFREGDHPDKLCDHKHCDHGDMFLIYHPTMVNSCLISYVNIWVDAPHNESLACHV